MSTLGPKGTISELPPASYVGCTGDDMTCMIRASLGGFPAVPAISRPRPHLDSTFFAIESKIIPPVVLVALARPCASRYVGLGEEPETSVVIITSRHWKSEMGFKKQTKPSIIFLRSFSPFLSINDNNSYVAMKLVTSITTTVSHSLRAVSMLRYIQPENKLQSLN